MNKEIYEMQYVKDFLRYVVHPIWLQQRKLRPHRPVMYQLIRRVDEKKRSHIFVVDFSQEFIKHNIEDEITFRVTQKKFVSNEYDFSDEWQQYQLENQQSQTL
jgi:hypothetical protein